MKLKYRKEIDFLRALAVIFVITFHFYPNFLPNGYLGVDMFFVISGFLISYQIYKSIKDKEFFLKEFYIKRLKRILPASIFVLVIVFIVSYFLLTNNDFLKFYESLIYSLFFSSNFFFWFDGGYFGPNDELKPLLHFWSLAIEEQFYLFFPLTFIFFLKFLKNKVTLIIFIIVITAISLFLNILLIQLGGSIPAFFLMPTRIWNLSFGVLAMLIYVSSNKKHSEFEIIFYILLIFLSLFVDIPYIPKNFLITFSCFMILRKQFPKYFLLKNIIENKLIIYTGLISFSLYLWHWPLLVFLKYYIVEDLTNSSKIILLIIVFALSVFTYHLVEKNFRYKITTSTFTFSILLIYFLFFSYSFNFQDRKNIKYNSYSADFISSASLTNYRCKVSDNTIYNGLRACYINKIDNKDYDFALLGNSHAQMYVPSFLPKLKSFKREGILLPMNWCLPTLTVNLDKNCMNLAKDYYENYINDKKIKKIIIATSWWHKKLFDGNKYIDDFDHINLTKSLLDLISKINRNGKEVYLIGPIQVPLYELPQELSRLVKFKHINNYELQERLKEDRSIFDKNYIKSIEILEANLGPNFINLSKTQCDEKFCYYGDEKGIYFADGSHLSKYGTNKFMKSLEIIFE